MLEALALQLSPHNRTAAASSCKALAAAVCSITTGLSIQAESDIRAAAARVSEGHYPRVVSLELKPPAVNTNPAVLHSLLSALSAKLQQLTAHGLKPEAIPSIQHLRRFQQLRSLHLSFPSSSPLQAEDCYDLNRALKHLKPLTQLSLSIVDWPPHARPLKALRHLTNLQQLSLGGEAWVSKLPPALTSLTLAGGSGWALNDVSSCLQLQQLHFEAAELPDELSMASDLWGVLTPLTALTALEGTLGELENMMEVDASSWAQVGSGAPESLAVVKRLRRLALAVAPGGFLMDDEVHLAMQKVGDMQTLTNLEVLWVYCSMPEDVPGLPSSLQELRLGLGYALGFLHPLDLRFLKTLTKLTVEVGSMRAGTDLILPTTLKELIVVTDEHGELRVPGVRPAPLPKLTHLSYWGNSHHIWDVDVSNILAMSTCLE